MEIGEKCYLLTSKGSLMPACFVGEVNEWQAEVCSPAGDIYKCQKANLFDDLTGRLMNLQKRGENLVAMGYDVAIKPDGSFRVFHMKRHGKDGGYILRRDGERICCTCPSWNAETALCKHVLGLCSLLYAKAQQAREQGKVMQANRWELFAQRIAFGEAPEPVETPTPPRKTREERSRWFDENRERDFA